MVLIIISLFFFFFNDTATTEIYTLSLHDALPIFRATQDDERHGAGSVWQETGFVFTTVTGEPCDPRNALRALKVAADRKSTRLNSSHANISYAVFCLKKKKKKKHNPILQHILVYV